MITFLGRFGYLVVLLLCFVGSASAITRMIIRCFAIGLGISTFRLLIPLLMLPPIEASFSEAWETVAWLGFVINLGAAEVWINLTRRQPAASTPARFLQRAERSQAKEKV